MKYLILASLLVLSVACGKDKDKDKDKGGGKDKIVQEDMNNVTNTSICNNSAVNPSIFARKWMQVHQGETIHAVTHMTITPTSISKRVICQRNAVSTSVTVTVNARVTERTFEILTTDEASQSITESNGDILTCTASLLRSSGERAYSFEGPCLKIVMDGAQQIFPPMN